MPAEKTHQDQTDGLLHLFADTQLSITAAFDSDDDENEYHNWALQESESCPTCGEHHRPEQTAECPYGGCYDGEHCPQACPYESGHTDWDRIYPHLPDTMHRGMSLRLPHDFDPAAPPHRMASTIAANLREYGSGTHWTPHGHMARHYAAVSHRDGDDLHVVLHAAKPDRDDIEEDPHELLKHDVIGFGEHADAEIPLQHGVPVKLTGISYRRPGESAWTRHDFRQPVEHRAVLTRTAGAAERERFAPREGESASWGVGRDRIVHALSMGHLHIEDAAQLGYGRGSGEGMDEDRRDGWQTLPRQLWHTTTNADQARQGLKTRAEMGMRHGHGLGGGADNTISLTDSREHAHNMLAGLWEYHDVLTGKTPLSQLEEHARTGHGAQRGPYLDYQHSMTGYPEPDRHSMMRGMRHIPDLMTDAEASQRGLRPHPTNHHRARIGDMGGGWERPATPEELSYDRSEIFKAHVNARRFAGGPRPILFMSNDPHALAQKKPEDFAVLRVSSRPGAQGYRIKGEHEWRTGTGDALHVHGTDAPPDGEYHPTPGFPHTAGGKPWLPHDRFFGPGHPGLDPRLFDGDDLKPAWRRALLGLVNRAFADYTYRDPASWQRWASAYLAGSQASHWYGNDDLDVLVGIDYGAFRRAQPRYRTMSDRDIDEMLNARAHEVCDAARWFTINGERFGPFDSTVYVNPDSYDIRKIKPYAAYDLRSDRWAVKPVQVPDDFGPDKLPSADFLYARSLASQVRALRKLPAGQAKALGAALYDKLHGERHDAFSGHGGGLYDVRNVAWKYLALHPEKPMEKLVAWKRAEQADPARHTAGMSGPGSDADFNDDSVMIALVPPRDVAERIALPDGKGEPADQMHVTLAYIPHVAPGDLGRLTGTVAEWASRQQPIVARLQGAGTFVNPGKHVLWGAVDIPGSSHLHSSLVDALRAAKFQPSTDHGFTAHLTISYEKYHVRFLPKITPVSFTCHSVYVCQGDNWRPMPVGGSTGGKVT